MKRVFFKTTLSVIFLILFSCSSEEENSINNPNQGNPSTNTIDNRQPTGSSSNDLLSATQFKKVILEIAYIEGFEPLESTKENLKTFINNRMFKPQGVEVVSTEIQETGKTEYSINDIVELENQHRTKYNSENTLAVWLLFVNGNSTNNTSSGSVLGTAYYNTSFVIFEETIREFSNSAFEPERSLLEATVVNHEFGHLLGLTNLGANLQSDHEDADHPKHCNVESCLMYWAAETSQGIGNLFSSGQVAELDAQCIADLQANGGK